VEVLISDKLVDELMVAIDKPGEGLWRLKGESVVRRSEKPEIARAREQYIKLATK
jgi:hypothetical protein